MAAETQVLIDNEKKYVAKFFSDASESDVKKIDLSTLNWAKHTLTLSGSDITFPLLIGIYYIYTIYKF